MDRDGFRALVMRLGPRLRMYACARVGVGDADDIVAGTFEVLWRRRELIPADDDGQRAWATAIARNLVRRYWSSHQNAQDVIDVDAWDVDTYPGSTDLVESVIGREEARALIGALSPEERRLMLLIGVDGLSTEHVAELLGISTSAVTTRLHRLRVRLLRDIEDSAMDRELTNGKGGR